MLLLHQMVSASFTPDGECFFYTRWWALLLHQMVSASFTPVGECFFYTRWWVLLLHQMVSASFTPDGECFFYTRWWVLLLHQWVSASFTPDGERFFYTKDVSKVRVVRKLRGWHQMECRQMDGQTAFQSYNIDLCLSVLLQVLAIAAMLIYYSGVCDTEIQRWALLKVNKDCCCAAILFLML